MVSARKLMLCSRASRTSSVPGAGRVGLGGAVVTVPVADMEDGTDIPGRNCGPLIGASETLAVGGRCGDDTAPLLLLLALRLFFMLAGYVGGYLC